MFPQPFAEHLCQAGPLPLGSSPPREGAALGPAAYEDEMVSLIQARILREGISPRKVVEGSFEVGEGSFFFSGFFLLSFSALYSPGSEGS